MCLDSLDKKAKIFTEGYAVKRKMNDGSYRHLFNNSLDIIVSNTWYTRYHDFIPFWNTGITYESGFHFFRSLQGAQHWKNNLMQNEREYCVILHAKVSGIVASGKQEGYVAGVAREIMYVKEMK